jgi:hypothetical protein
MPIFRTRHIILDGHTLSLPYTSNSKGGTSIVARPGINRTAHADLLNQEFETAIESFQGGLEEDFAYVVFKSADDFQLDLDKFEDLKNNFRLASYKCLETGGEQNHIYYEATVFLNRNAISKFLEKVQQFKIEDTIWEKPKHLSLMANIEEIQAATLKSFWQEPELPFPQENEDVWWEIWVSRDTDAESSENIDLIVEKLEEADVQIGLRRLVFPEHVVFLAKGSAAQLGATILYTDRLAELRKPRETADLFTYMERAEQAEWIQDLRQRVDNFSNEGNISICLLDTGVNRANQLLEDLIPEANLDSINPAWGLADSHHRGHGTPMAGLSFYGDLTDVLASASRIQIFHHLESIKFIHHSAPHDPDLYGAVTLEGIARAEIMNPQNKRVVCLAITSPEPNHLGKPTSWSGALDNFMFGSNDNKNQTTLILVSSGNVAVGEVHNYPNANETTSIEDPAQSFNALTVGSYTLKDNVNLDQFPASSLMASRGCMSPCNSTSMNWLNEWPRKPEIVMEGGNKAIQNGNTIEPDSLQILSTGKGGLGRSQFLSFGDTSGSTALASKFAAELYHFYPTLWPETIRALIIHSADWTNGMLGNRVINQLPIGEKMQLLSSVGYGVPNLDKAKESANNSLSLIVERTIKPYKLVASTVKTEEFHLFELPWPVEALQQLFDAPITLKITLSYFIEPNPGNKQYNLAASYRSHGLRFKVIGNNESLPAFKARVSSAMKEEGYQREGNEPWVLGSQVRDKGSIHKDLWIGTASELSTRNKIAVYPVGGWWKTRKKLKRYNNTGNYSLIITLESPDQNIDILTPVLNLVDIDN